MTVNKVILIGNLGADPELRTTNSGMAVAKIRLATSERRKDRDGNWSDHTEWHNVVVFGKTAENAGRYLTKGSQVFFEGRLRTNKWQDKEGRDRWTTEVLADSMRFIGSKAGGQGGGQASSSAGQRRDRGGYSDGQNNGGGYGSQGGEDIPF